MAGCRARAAGGEAAGGWVAQAGYLADIQPLVAAFLQGLREAGYVENQNVLIEYRYARGAYERFQLWPPNSWICASI